MSASLCVPWAPVAAAEVDTEVVTDDAAFSVAVPEQALKTSIDAASVATEYTHRWCCIAHPLFTIITDMASAVTSHQRRRGEYGSLRLPMKI